MDLFVATNLVFVQHFSHSGLKLTGGGEGSNGVVMVSWNNRTN
jgi:hypothetical protein